MFTELMPLLKQRVVVMTISRVDDERVCVSVIPKKRDSTTEEDPILTIALSFTGRPGQLDREMPAQLAGYTESVIKTGSNLEKLKAQRAAAVKAMDAEIRKKLEEKRKASSKIGPPTEKATPGPEIKDGKPLFGSKGSCEPVATASLFDAVEKQECPAEKAPQSAPVPEEPLEVRREKDRTRNDNRRFFLRTRLEPMRESTTRQFGRRVRYFRKRSANDKTPRPSTIDDKLGLWRSRPISFKERSIC